MSSDVMDRLDAKAAAGLPPTREDMADLRVHIAQVELAYRDLLRRELSRDGVPA